MAATSATGSTRRTSAAASRRRSRTAGAAARSAGGAPAPAADARRRQRVRRARLRRRHGHLDRVPRGHVEGDLLRALRQQARVHAGAVRSGQRGGRSGNRRGARRGGDERRGHAAPRRHPRVPRDRRPASRPHPCSGRGDHRGGTGGDGRARSVDAAVRRLPRRREREGLQTRSRSSVCLSARRLRDRWWGHGADLTTRAAGQAETATRACAGDRPPDRRGAGARFAVSRRDSLAALEREVIACRRCPRLVAWRERTARIKRAAYAGEDYWGRPLPGFGDPRARVLVLGLAPAAHGGNRTGRIFTGDRSGDWLFAALWRTGFASQPESTRLGDGLKLSGCYVTAAVRCAPPQNKPSPSERDNCLPYLLRELRLIDTARVIMCLGAFAWDCAARLLGGRR